MPAPARLNPAGAPAAGRQPLRRAPGGRPQPGAAALMLVVAVGSMVLAASPASFMVLATGLMPTVVGYLMEVGRQRSVLPCLAALNLAGVAPVLGSLWQGGGNMAAARQLLNDPLVWLLMYGSAALAGLLLWAGPKAALAVLEANARWTRRRIQHARTAILDEWGTPPP